MEWKNECGECQLSAEQQERLNQFTREELLSLISDLVCNNPRASAILKNKWLTKPHDILFRVKEKYEEETREQLSFRDENKISVWLSELYYAILSPLDNIIPVLPHQSETLILFLISDWRRLYEEIIPAGDDNSWQDYLLEFWLKAVCEGANGDIDYIEAKIDSNNECFHMYDSLTSLTHAIHKLPEGELKNTLIRKYDI
ncbi:hypothetical protein [Serratia entomophila]|uniref:hypothetical protein n=1 Tax=Serratia entomophila TaxID=42906 RepID=UPI0021777293|nr:hypothetical protein [Serratia entomophila]CAI1050181.1 Uncharacterised protein [Serratia entomophila]CAI1838522.1 Uncharacterised protein [Serratia entomophila]CAI2503341.1 Uncharacterised protein [Serratia entomophila]